MINVGEDGNDVSIVVADEDYPTALGKRGMNAKLNGDLCNVHLHVQKMSQYQAAMDLERAQLANAEDPTLDAPLAIEGIHTMIIESLVSAGFDTARKILTANRDILAKIPEISLEMADKILEQLRKKLRSQTPKEGSKEQE